MSALAASAALGILTGLVLVPRGGKREIFALATHPGLETDFYLKGGQIDPWGFAAVYVNSAQSRADFFMGAIGARMSLVGAPIGDPSGSSPITIYSARTFEPYIFGGVAAERYELMRFDEERQLVEHTSMGLGAIGGVGCNIFWEALFGPPPRRILSKSSLSLTSALTIGAFPVVSGNLVIQPLPVTIRFGVAWN